MKNIIYIDNETEDSHKDDFDIATDCLYFCCGIEDDIISKIEPVLGLYHLKNEEITKILFKQNQVIVTYSLYSKSHFGSLYQMLFFLEKAGENNIKDIVYIDTSGNIKEALERNITTY